MRTSAPPSKRPTPDATVNFEFLGSQELLSNLSEGSAADVLATADTDIMDSAVSQGLVGDPQEFATNTLSIIVPEGNPAGITGFDDSLNAEGVNLVICDPESHVPCGTATKKMEEATGVTLADPASKETKVSDVRSKVESGEADAGSSTSRTPRQPRAPRRSRSRISASSTTTRSPQPPPRRTSRGQGLRRLRALRQGPGGPAEHLQVRGSRRLGCRDQAGDGEIHRGH